MFGGFKRYRAVLNAMNAKYTWQKLSEEEQRNVDMQARMLYAAGGKASMDGDVLIKAAQASDTFSRFNEFELYSMYSTAMIEGYIEPATPESWDPPVNPFALRIKPADVQKAERHFKVNHGIDISLSLER